MRALRSSKTSKTPKAPQSPNTPVKRKTIIESERNSDKEVSEKTRKMPASAVKGSILKRSRPDSSEEEEEKAMESPTPMTLRFKQEPSSLKLPGKLKFKSEQDSPSETQDVKVTKKQRVSHTADHGSNELQDIPSPFKGPSKVKAPIGSAKNTSKIPQSVDSDSEEEREEQEQEEKESDEESDEDEQETEADTDAEAMEADNEDEEESHEDTDTSNSSNKVSKKKGKGKDTSKITIKDSKMVYMEDFTKAHKMPMQPDNEDPALAVMQEDLQDKSLKRFYKSLPWLSPARLNTFGTPTNGPTAFVMFSLLKSYIEPFDKKYLLNWVNFQKSGSFVNLSRVDPKLLSKSQENAYGASFLIEPGRTNGYLLAISMMVVNSSSLLTLKMSTKGDWGQKKVGGTLLSQEMERLAGCLGMVFGFDSVEASMYGSELYFMAKREYLSRPSSPVKARSGGGFYNNVPSPAVGSSSQSETVIVPSLSKVPIYDGQKVKLDLTKDLGHLDEKLPLWKDGKEEAPRDSLAIVGYTVNTYKQKDMLHLSLNVQWLIILGSPVV